MSWRQLQRQTVRRWTRWIVLGWLALGFTMAAPALSRAAVETDGGILHVVQRGETLWGIARQYGVSVGHLVHLNELSEPNRLVVGQKLVIREGEARVHIVQRGDTLTSIAAQYGVRVQDLVALNEITNPNVLSLGQQVVVTPRVQRTHVVTGGDTLWDIARTYEVTVDAIQSANGLPDPGQLRVGQKLVIPAIGGGEDVVAVPALARTTERVSALSWPVQGRVTSNFGPRWGRVHNGMDIAAPTGTPIHAAAAGKVTYSGWAGTYGQLVIIDHGNGLETRYAHISQSLVRVGDQVQRGQRIALVGSTGNSTGPHLHLEVLVDGTPQDPASWLVGR